MLLCVLEIRKMSLNAFTSGLVKSFANPHSGNRIATNINGINMSLVRTLGLVVVSGVVIYVLLLIRR